MTIQTQIYANSRRPLWIPPPLPSPLHRLTSHEGGGGGKSKVSKAKKSTSQDPSSSHPRRLFGMHFESPWRHHGDIIHRRSSPLPTPLHLPPAPSSRLLPCCDYTSLVANYHWSAKRLPGWVTHLNYPPYPPPLTPLLMPPWMLFPPPPCLLSPPLLPTHEGRK